TAASIASALRTTRSALFLPSIRRLSSLPLVTGFLILFSSSFVVRHFFFSLRPFGSNRSLQNFYENCLDILPRSSVKRRSTPTITPGGKQKCKNKITLPSMRIFFELRSSCFCFSPSARSHSRSRRAEAAKDHWRRGERVPRRGRSSQTCRLTFMAQHALATAHLLIAPAAT